MTDMDERIERVRRYTNSIQFHTREDCTELKPANGWNVCNCGLRIIQAKMKYVLDILDDKVELRNHD